MIQHAPTPSFPLLPSTPPDLETDKVKENVIPTYNLHTIDIPKLAEELSAVIPSTPPSEEIFPKSSVEKITDAASLIVSTGIFSDGQAWAFKRASRAQLTQARRNSAMEWGEPRLSERDYLQLEEFLEEHAKPFVNGLVCWVLVPASDPNTLDLFCFSETYQKKAYYATGIPSQETCTIVPCLSIASVFTVPNNRGRGYAKVILDEMRKECQKSGVGVSTLYSDIGKDYYSKMGWQAYPSISSIITPEGLLYLSDFFNLPRNSIAEDQNNLLSTTFSCLRILNINSLNRILRHDAKILKSELTLVTRPSIAIIPECSAFDWLYKRSIFYHMHAGRAIPRIIGVEWKGDTHLSGAAPSFITWQHCLDTNKLFITRLRYQSSDGFMALFQCAIREALASNLTLELWNPPKNLLTSLLPTHQIPGFSLEERSESISSMTLCQSLNFGTKDTSANVVDWIANEYYSWV